MANPDELLIACRNCDATFDVLPVWNLHVTPEIFWCPICDDVNPVPSGGHAHNKANQPAKRGPRDLKFNEAKPYLHDDDAIYRKLPSRTLLLPVGAFLTNIRRLKGLLEIPSEIVLSSFNLAQAVNDEQEESDEEKPIGEDIIAKFKSYQTAEVTDPSVRESVKGISNFILSVTRRRVWHGLDAILTSQITGAWTAFEVLSGDLWEAALNVHPQYLSDLKNKRPKGNRPKSGSPSDKPERHSDDFSENEKMIRWNRFQEFNFDLSSKMGTLLRPRFDFSDIDDARDAYWSAFGGGEVTNCIDSECLTKLAKTRNLLVHRSGVIDKKFKGFMENIDKNSTFEEGLRFAINGEVVNDLIRPVLDVSFRLIYSVDQWIIDNPQPHKETV